jgi:FkbM family methyltransferase
MRKKIRGLLNKIGYDIVKVNVQSDSKAGKIKAVKVGKFMIDMPGNSPQISTYKYEPGANAQLGRLSSCIAQKYPALTVIDIGANMGDTIAIIKSFTDLPIIGIEGDDIAYGFLEKNSVQFQNISLIKEFLGEKRETMHVTLEKTGWNTTIVPSQKSDKVITLKTLDEVLRENDLGTRTLKLLKIDTEGFDTIIIRGAEEMIQKHRPVIYFEYNRSNMEAIGEDGLSTLFSLEKYGYSSIVFFDNKGRYVLTAPINQQELVRQLHSYSDENKSGIAYFDICLFHDTDSDIAAKFIEGELHII